MNHQVMQTAPAADTSPGVTSKYPDWVQNSDNAKHQASDTKNSNTAPNSDNSASPDQSPTHSAQNSSEPNDHHQQEDEDEEQSN